MAYFRRKYAVICSGALFKRLSFVTGSKWRFSFFYTTYIIVWKSLKKFKLSISFKCRFMAKICIFVKKLSKKFSQNFCNRPFPMYFCQKVRFFGKNQVSIYLLAVTNDSVFKSAPLFLGHPVYSNKSPNKFPKSFTISKNRTVTVTGCNLCLINADC